jgi:hypothetical protein
MMTNLVVSCPCNEGEYCQDGSQCRKCTACDATEYAWRACTATTDQRCAVKPKGFFVKFEGMIRNTTLAPTRAVASPLFGSALELTAETCAWYCTSAVPSCDGFEIATSPNDADQTTVDCLLFNSLSADNQGQPTTQHTFTFQLGQVCSEMSVIHEITSGDDLSD